MDAFQRIALEFKEDCEKKLNLLEMATTVIGDSDTVGLGLQKLFCHSGVYPGDYDQIRSFPLEMERLRNCIDSIEVVLFFFSGLCTRLIKYIQQETLQHARKLFIINFNSPDKFLVFNQEICFSYACKMLNSIGPRLYHFSNSPTSEEVINAELFLAMNSPYQFNENDDLLCYESMPSMKEAGKT